MITIKKTLCPDATYTVQYEDTTPIASGSIVSGGSALIEVPNCVGASVGATLMRTGATTVYRTGDDSDKSAEGRATDFFTLASNNPFGNTNRFTDELGGATYTNNIVIDWSTYNGSNVLGYRRTDNGVDIAWNNAIDNCLALSIGTFTTGWRLPNANEMNNLYCYEATLISPLGAQFSFSPFNLTFSQLWTSTTLPVSTVQAMRTEFNHRFIYQVKTTSTNTRYIPCRTFTVTGTTLS